MATHARRIESKTSRHRRLFWWLLLLSWAVSPGPLCAHDFRLGSLRIDHPYALPGAAGQTTAVVYFKGVRNTGAVADALLSASTPVAAAVELHRMQPDAAVMRTQAVPAIEFPAHSDTSLRHGNRAGYCLQLLGLKAPLKDGERFSLHLRFRQHGELEVMVWVQTPHAGVNAQTGH